MPDDDAYEELVERARAGDRQAFRVLVRRTYRPALRVAGRLLGDLGEAEDAVQEAYVQAWSGLDELRDPSAARSWILAYVRNVALTRARGPRRRRARIRVAEGPAELERLATLLTSDEPLPEDASAAAELGRAVWRLVDELDDKYRVPLLLRAVDGMSYDELAEVLGLTKATVATRLRRARQRLATRLEETLGIEVKVSA